MAKIIDVRGSGGDLVVLGKALALPTDSSATAAQAGSIRYNGSVLQIYTASAWAALTGSLGATGPSGPSGPTGPTGASGPTGPGLAAIATNDLIANISGISAAPSATTLPLFLNAVYPALTGTFTHGLAGIGSDGFVPWAQLKPGAQILPLGFVIPGQPNGVYNLVVAQAITVPANLAGTVIYDGIVTTSDAVFTLNQISGGSTTARATLTVTSGSHTSVTLSVQSSFNLAAGDVMQLVAPSPQDPTLADVGITVLTFKI